MKHSGLSCGLLVGALIGAATFASAQPDDAPAPGETAKAVVGAFDNLFQGPHSGHRAVHAKGILLDGEFRPSEAAAMLSRADHFQQPVPVTVRFSDFAGIPSVPDGAAEASPRGMSIKFKLPDGGDTDIVAHSYDGFPVATGQEFVEFLTALATPSPAALKAFLASHPAAQTFADTSKPAPVSFGTERFFGVNSFRFTNTAGIGRFGRYRIEPIAGPAHLTAREAGALARDYLADEMAARLKRGAVEFRLTIQLAAQGDDVLDGSKPWPQERTIIDAGVISLTRMIADSEAKQRNLLFTPLNLVAGIAPSADPLLVARNRAYRVSFDRRRDRPEMLRPTVGYRQ